MTTDLRDNILDYIVVNGNVSYVELQRVAGEEQGQAVGLTLWWISTSTCGGGCRRAWLRQ
jgi:hypothetical protein